MDGPERNESDRAEGLHPRDEEDGQRHAPSSDTPVQTRDHRRYDAGRKYRAVWQEIHPWVSRAVPDEEFAYCAACRRTFRPRITVLVAHEKSAKHAENWRRFRAEQSRREACAEAEGDSGLAMAEAGQSGLTLADSRSTPSRRWPAPASPNRLPGVPGSSHRERSEADVAPPDREHLLPLNASVEAIMEAVGPRVFDKLSMWEIILHKATQSPDVHAMDLVIQDVESILMELKLLMSHCFDHVDLAPRSQRESLDREKVGVNLSKFLANAIEVESGFWHPRDPDSAPYRNGLEVGLLIPPGSSDVPIQAGSPTKRKTRSQKHVEDPEYVARRRVPGQPIRPTKCAKCGKEYGPGESPKTHRPLCPASLKYKKVGAFMYCSFDRCPHPERGYTLRQEILRHFDEHHFTDEARTIPCTYDGCPGMFATVTLRNIHIRQSHEKLFACHQCPKRFWSEKNLNGHIKNGHTLKDNGEAPAQAVELCRKCGKMMVRTSLSKHESRCTGYACRNPQWKEENGELFCTVSDCHIKHGFATMYGLRVHFFTSHLDEAEKQFECEHCGKRYADRIMFRKHVKAVHVKPYWCNLCPHRFGNKSQLDEHKKIHTGDKPHACDKCDFKCAKKSNLIDHKLKKHNDLAGRNYHCGICGKVFFTSGRLTSHFRIIHHDGLVLEGAPKKRGVKRGKTLSKRVVLVDGPAKNLTGHTEQDMAADFLMNQNQADDLM